MKILVALVSLCMILGCDEPPEFIKSNLRQDLKSQLDTYTQSFDDIPGAWLQVDFGDSNPILLTSGVSEVTGQEPLTIDHVFRMASISKIFTAVIILQLQEEGSLSLDHSITQYLNPDQVKGLHQAHLIANITIKTLLQHTSGIDNYVNLSWTETLLDNTSKVWTPEHLIAYTVEHGTPHHAPGSSFYYSDTNYTLLGLVIESITKQGLHQTYRERIFTPLELKNTFLESQEDVSTLPLAHGYYEAIDLYSWNTSSDWAAGGLVTTTKDLTIFFSALLDGQLFGNPGTVHVMQDWLPVGSSSKYGLGIGEYIINGRKVMGHGGQGFGFTSGLYYYPEQQTIICLSVNQQATDIAPFEQAVIRTIDTYR